MADKPTHIWKCVSGDLIVGHVTAATKAEAEEAAKAEFPGLTPLTITFCAEDPKVLPKRLELKFPDES